MNCCKTPEARLDQLMSLGRPVIEGITAEESRQPALFPPRQFHDPLDQAPAARTAGTDPFGVDPADCREDHRVGIGVRQAFGAVHGRPGWEGLSGSRRAGASRMVREMVLARVARPQSKRAMVARLRQEGVPALNLTPVHRGMDAVTDARVDAICALSRERARTLLPDPITVVFHDTTTPCFGSERENGLRFRGYGKDGRPHRVQVVPALPITPEGLPVGYGLFPGNLHGGHTPVKALAALERRHPETRFTLVADAGMPGRANRRALRDRGTPYIPGARLKACPKAPGARIPDVAAYAAWGRAEYADPVAAVRDPPLEDGGRPVVTHSPRRARRDARDRARRLGKPRGKPDRGATPAAPGASATARFLDFPEGRVTINGDRIAAAAAWDGLRGIVAWGCDAEDPRDLMGQYRRLAEIGSRFRTNRHDLRIRPVFHWQDRRIRAHIAIRYMAFCRVRHLRCRPGGPRRSVGPGAHPGGAQRTAGQPSPRNRRHAQVRTARSRHPGRSDHPPHAGPDMEHRTLSVHTAPETASHITQDTGKDQTLTHRNPPSRFGHHPPVTASRQGPDAVPFQKLEIRWNQNFTSPRRHSEAQRPALSGARA